MTDLFYLENLSDSKVLRGNPWDYTGKHPDREKWGDPKVKYHHFSGYEGLVPGVRVSGANPAAIIHALVADFDALITEEQRTKAVAKCKVPPNYTSQTGKGGARMVWLLAEPCPIHDTKVLEAFLGHVAKRLNLARLLPEWDREAWLTPATYYAAGTEWKAESAAPIPPDTVAGWMVEACRRINWCRGGNVVIPVEVIRAEAESRWPGGWGGSWEPGSRGRNFWEPSSGNPRACVLRETGMQAFSGSKGFFSWRDIFGPAFVEKYEADRMGQATRNIYFDGEYYWVKEDDAEWEKVKRVDLLVSLKVRGLSAEKPKHDTSSEVDQAINHINMRQRVVYAGQYAYFPTGLLRMGGNLVLNRSRLRVLDPVLNHDGTWGGGFPVLAQWLDSLFAQPIQLDNFLAWVRRFYRGAHNRRPDKILCIFMCGPVGRGKTFLSDRVLSTLLGGHYDISDYATDGGQFSNGCYDYGLWTIGDARPNQDYKSRQHYTVRIKKLVANRQFLANEKYEKAYMTHWYGGLVVTCNDDPVSIGMLPDLDQSISDKVTFLRINPKSDPVFANPDQVLEDELPHFAGWLLASQDATTVEPDTRFGHKAYHDDYMRDTIHGSSRVSSFEEVLASSMPDIAGSSGEWSGTATDLFKALSNADSASMREYTATTVGMFLGQLLSFGRPYLRYKRSAKRREYNLGVTDLESYFSPEVVAVEADVPDWVTSNDTHDTMTPTFFP